MRQCIATMNPVLSSCPPCLTGCPASTQGKPVSSSAAWSGVLPVAPQQMCEALHGGHSPVLPALAYIGVVKIKNLAASAFHS